MARHHRWKDDAVSSVFCFVFWLVLQALGIRLQILSSKLTKKASRFLHLLHPPAIFSPHISRSAERSVLRDYGGILLNESASEIQLQRAATPPFAAVRSFAQKGQQYQLFRMRQYPTVIPRTVLVISRPLPNRCCGFMMRRVARNFENMGEYLLLPTMIAHRLACACYNGRLVYSQTGVEVQIRISKRGALAFHIGSQTRPVHSARELGASISLRA
ncbi:hypothetical protein B0H13DRAFT_2272722 [Mycena leptocephala]|nr:hypothetical protein B0H13DRAFT_2272722 [Mycena leptocephala]